MANINDDVNESKPSISEMVNSLGVTVDLSEIQFPPYHPKPKLGILSASIIVQTEVEPIRSTQCHFKGKGGKQTAYHTKKIHAESVKGKIIKTEPSTDIVVFKEEEEECCPLRITTNVSVLKRQTYYSTQKRSCSSVSVADIEEEDVKLTTNRGKRQTTCSSEDISKCARYRELRDKNNQASRRSRQSRKAREEEMKFQLAELEEKNQRLRIVQKEKQKQVDALRQTHYSTQKRSCSSVSVADIDEEDVKLPAKRGKRQTTCSSKDISKCARYRELRDKNNQASRRSRQSRKAREEEMKFQLAELEEKNQRLRIVQEEKQKQVDALRELLVKVMTSRKE